MRDRLTRLGALIGLGGKLVWQRLRHTAPRRTTMTIIGVAFAVGLFVTVSGVSVALATQGSVVGSNVDYWVVPEGESSSTLPVAVGGPQFGDVHSVADQLTASDDVAYASPVSLGLFQLTYDNTTEYVLVAGVVSHDGLTVAGVNASGLTQGDPHYANGTYSGPWTGEVVLSTGASELLNASEDDAVMIPNQTAAMGQPFTVTAVTDGGESGLGTVPIALIHLSEFQTLTEGTTSDTADQLLVSTNDVGVREELATLYPHSQVSARSDSGFLSVTNSDLALALAAAGFAVSLIVGVLFVATTMGLEVTTDRRLWATLTAVGFSTSSRTFLLFLQTTLITITGGILGVILGRLGVFAANTAIAGLLGETVVAVYPIEFVGYGLAVALGIAFLTTPYLLWLTTRGTVTDTLAT
jgi:putative ABC transport system permease protein